MMADSVISRERLARTIWLNYFNDYLRERQVITEQEWQKMRHLIK